MLQRPGGEFGADFDGFWLGFPHSPQQTIRTFQEWIRLQLAGVVESPGLFAFTLGLQPTRVQTRWNNSITPIDGGGDRVDLDAQATALGAAPVSLSLRRTQSRGHEDGVFGTESRARLSETGASLSFRLPALPGSLDYSNQSRDVTYRTGGQQTIRQAETVRTFRLTAQNSKLNTYLEHLSFEDHAFRRDFKQERAFLGHLVSWGLRSSLTSSLQYVDRTGAFPIRQVIWSERLHLQHIRGLASDHQYRHYTLQSSGPRSSGRSGAIRLGYQINPNLFVGTQSLGESDHFGLGQRSLHRQQAEARYTVDLPVRGVRARLGLGLVGGYEWRRQQPSAQASVAVANEPHVVDASLKFFLDEPFAESGSVVLTSADGTTTFQEAFDYRLAAAGALLTVLVLPSGRIAVGDTVLATYRFDQLPGGRASALIAEYRLDLHIEYVTLYHRRARFDRQDGTSPAQLLVDRDDATTGLRVSRRLATGLVDFEAEHQRRRSDFYEFRSNDVRGSFTQQMTPTIQGAFGAGASWSYGGGTSVTLRSLNISVGWMPLPVVELHGRVTGWRWSQEGVQSQRFAGSGLDAQWRIGQAQLMLRYDGGWWKEGFDHSQNRLLVQVRRRF